ncbi:Double-stranded RNA-binding [Artemisia annua]|uniref:Double-stranded RNA-binding n=1 Tax=Artemisia annua TaxID=35608 RepID=A0A2U1M2X0_ARTAN|nr:Double-stranded RNA-binding [Artemisia annua]
MSKRQRTTSHRTPSNNKIIYTYGADSMTSSILCTMNIQDSVAAVESILGYTFKDKTLLEEALTHSSYTESQSYQRLEFLGDAALGNAISSFLYMAYPDLDPGRLSLLRAANISTEKLARVAVQHGLHKYVRNNAADMLSDKVREFVDVVEGEQEMVVHGGQIKAPKVLADIVESVAAAVYVDSGFNLHKMWEVIRELLEPIIMLNVLEKKPQPITMLFELCQKDAKHLEIKHCRKGNRNSASVFVDGIFIASGSSETKENAKLHAAEAALSKLTRSNSISAIVPYGNGGLNKATEIEGAKQKLHELCNKKRWPKATYKVKSEQGPAHDRRYTSSVEIDVSNNAFIVTGEERSRVKDAENSAASVMFCALQRYGLI